MDLKNQLEVLKAVQKEAKEENVAVIAVIHDLKYHKKLVWVAPRSEWFDSTRILQCGGNML